MEDIYEHQHAKGEPNWFTEPRKQEIWRSWKYNLPNLELQEVLISDA